MTEYAFCFFAHPNNIIIIHPYHSSAHLHSYPVLPSASWTLWVVGRGMWVCQFLRCRYRCSPHLPLWWPDSTQAGWYTTYFINIFHHCPDQGPNTARVAPRPAGVRSNVTLVHPIRPECVLGGMRLVGWYFQGGNHTSWRVSLQGLGLLLNSAGVTPMTPMSLGCSDEGCLRSSDKHCQHTESYSTEKKNTLFTKSDVLVRLANPF